jgi:UPF0716 protein FxsA
MFFLRHLFISFFLFALAEAVLLAQVGAAIGWGITIGLIVLTALLGSIMFRRQGLLTLTRLNQRMAQGEMPGQEMLEGVLILLGGALLMTPGFLTDAIGFIFLIGASRRCLAAWMISKGIMQAMMKPGNAGGEQVWVYQQRSYRQAYPPDNDRTFRWGNATGAERDVSPTADRVSDHPASSTAPQQQSPRQPSPHRQGNLIEGDYQITDQDQPKA